jgi:hypothetical protein
MFGVQDLNRATIRRIGFHFPERRLAASILRVADDTPLVDDAAFPWLTRDTPFGRNCYIFAEGEFLQQRAQ